MTIAAVHAPSTSNLSCLARPDLDTAQLIPTAPEHKITLSHWGRVPFDTVNRLPTLAAV